MSSYYDTKTLEITLSPGDDERKFVCDMVQDIAQEFSKDSTSMALPGSDYRKNILMGLSGMESNITINFYIHDDGTDKSDGTLEDGDCSQMYSEGDGDDDTDHNFWHDSDGDGNYDYEVVTVEEQMHYLRRVIFDPGFTATWELNCPDDEWEGLKPFDNLEVFVSNVDYSWMNRDSPKWRICRLEAVVGSGVS